MTARKKSAFRPLVEALEDRNLMSAFAYLSGAGNLVILGTDAKDSASVNPSGSNYNVSLNGKTTAFPKAAVTGGQVYFYGHGENDFFSNNAAALKAIAYGGAGNDTLWGDGAMDSLYGESGNDVLHGWHNNDYLSGGDGADKLYGESGVDRLYGGNGIDLLEGGDGNDKLFGDAGNDTLHGGAGDDYLHGGSGTTEWSGGTGTDTFRRHLWDMGVGLSLTNQLASHQFDPGTGEPGDDVDTGISEAIPVSLTGGQFDSATDVKQANTPTCSFLAALAGTAEWTGANNDLVAKIRYNAASDTYTLPLSVGGRWTNITVTADWTEGRDPSGPLWVTLYQKAYLQAMNVTSRDANGACLPSEQWSYSNVNWKDGGVAATALTGYSSGWLGNGAANFTMATLRSDVDSGRWILIASSKPTTTSTKVVGDHSYMIVGCTATKVTLYNPWGKDGWQSGSLTVNTFALDGTNDGFISMTWADFAANFNGYWWN